MSCETCGSEENVYDFVETTHPDNHSYVCDDCFWCGCAPDKIYEKEDN